MSTPLEFQVRRFRRLVGHHGGFTLHSRTGRPFRDGLAVCSDPASTFGFALGDWSDGTVAAWIARHAPHLDDHRHLGAWVDASSWVWLDVVRVFPEHRREEAFALGVAHRQRAIFDLRRNVLLAVVPPRTGDGSGAVGDATFA